MDRLASRFKNADPKFAIPPAADTSKVPSDISKTALLAKSKVTASVPSPI